MDSIRMAVVMVMCEQSRNGIYMMFTQRMISINANNMKFQLCCVSSSARTLSTPLLQSHGVPLLLFHRLSDMSERVNSDPELEECSVSDSQASDDVDNECEDTYDETEGDEEEIVLDEEGEFRQVNAVSLYAI